MKKLILYGFLILCSAMLAQEKDKNLSEATSEFMEKNYRDAEANYRISQSKFPDKTVATYNLGNTIYNLNQSAEAGQSYIKAAEKATTRPEKHKAFHNLGNVFMNDKNYTAAVKAYREALINNPADNETRYNYALAKKFLKDNPPPPEDKKDKDKQAKKDQEEKSDQQREKDEKEKENKQKKQDEGDKEDKPNQPKPEPKEGQGIPKQRIENLLDAVNNEEKKVQDKINARQIKGKPVQTDKDW